MNKGINEYWKTCLEKKKRTGLVWSCTEDGYPLLTKESITRTPEEYMRNPEEGWDGIKKTKGHKFEEFIKG